MADSSQTNPTERAGWVAPLLLLALVAVFFGVRGMGGEWVDLRLQSAFWTGDTWVLPSRHPHPLLHLLLYTGPKALLILLALLLVAAAVVPGRFPAWLGRRRALFLLACAALVPVTCTQLRSVTRMATPSATQAFGGKWPHHVLFESKPDGHPSNGFPAGHASGGFSLLALAYAWPGRRARRAGAAAGLAAGWLMGVYQMARGEHFLSHTLATCLIAWLVVALLARAIRPELSGPTSS